MSQNSSQPSEADAVLGGQSQVPLGAVILGGLDGVRRRLKSSVAEQRVIALPEALQQGQQGLNLVIRALSDRSDEVRQTAYLLLKDRPEPKVQRAVERFYAERNYKDLRRLLARKQWQSADQETGLALSKACGVNIPGELHPEQIATLPCQDLQIIDQLWHQFSQGHFGFSVQRALWQKYDKTYWDKAETWRKFADRVGWRAHSLLADSRWKRYEEITFNLNAPVGHLPFMGNRFGIFTVEAIAQRLTSCQQS